MKIKCIKKKFLIVAFIFISVTIKAAWLSNYPVTVKQPDGTILNLFVTGDEYCNRVHDEKNYTVIKNAEGWVVYARLENGEFTATNYIFGKVDPESVGLVPGIDISRDRKYELRNNFLQYDSQTPESKSTAIRTGTLNNIVIYIEFPDETFVHTKDQIEPLFTGTSEGESLYSYFRDLSNGNFIIPSSFFPQSSTTILAYQAPNPRTYYEIDNHDDTGRLVEHTLVHEAIEYCKPQIESMFSASSLDYDNNNLVDNICIIVQGDPGAWSTLLWPHKWSLYTTECLTYINGKRVSNYNLLIENHLFSTINGQTKTIVHEMYHTLGAPDLYCYYYDDVDPVGYWDIMSHGLTPPQSSTAYITNHYGRFTPDIPEITHSGLYTLCDSWDRNGNPIAYKISSPTSATGEFFVLEYRRKNGGTVYESQIPDDGIIISRINPSEDGNSISNGTSEYPYGVYVYRQNGTNTSNGDLSNSSFSSTGLTYFSDDSSPCAFLSDNSVGLGGIVINNFSAAGDSTMTFYVNFPNTTYWEIGFPNAADVIAALDVDGTLSITGTGTMQNWEEGSIAPWNSVIDSITSIVVNSGVTNIGSYAFCNHDSLISVSVSNTVQYIGEAAFYQCSNLNSINLAYGLTDIENRAFASTNIASISIPNSVINIYGSAFRNCVNLATITIANSVENIYEHAFGDCFGLTDVFVNRPIPITISDTVFTNVDISSVNLNVYECDYYELYLAAPVWQDFNIGVYWETGYPYAANMIAKLNNGILTFNGTGAMQNWQTQMPWFCLKDEITSAVINNGITTIGTCAFEDNANLSSVTLPSGLTSIGGMAFAYCGLTSIDIPLSVTSVGQYAFRSCSDLTDVSVNWTIPLYVSNTVFNGVVLAGVNLHVPDGRQCSYDATPVWNNFNITKLTQTIIFPPIPAGTYGDTITLQATSSSGLTINYISSNTEVATLSGNTLNITGTGTAIISATQNGSCLYNEAPTETNVFTADKALLTITAENKVRQYGEENPEFTLGYSGFMNNDNGNVLDTLPEFWCEAVENSPVGFYDIILSGGFDNNYNFALVNGSLEITQISNTEDISCNQTIIYPNPAKCLINIKINSSAKIQNIQVFDAEGCLWINTVENSELNDPAKHSLDVSGLAAGFYTVNIWADGKLFRGKFVKI